MRRCVITKFDVSYDNRSVFDDRGGSYAGMSRGEPQMTARVDMWLTPDAATYLRQMMGKELDIADALGDLGADRPDLERAKARGREEGMMLAAKGATAEALAKLLRDGNEATATECGELHSSGAACRLPKGHGEHRTLKGWRWTEESEAKAARAKGRQPKPVCSDCKARDVSRSEVAVAAGLEGSATWAELLNAVQLLKIAADPPYEPKTKPKRATCPQCGSAAIVRLARRTQTEFTGCSAWPACNWTYVPPQPVRKPDTSTPAYARRELDFEDE